MAESKYNELISEYNKIKEEISTKTQKYVEEEASWDTVVNGLRDYKIQLYMLDKEIRLVKAPSINCEEPLPGRLMSIEMFKTFVKEQNVTDEDGYGLYAINKGVSDIKIIPSDIAEDKLRTDFLYVRWIENEPEDFMDIY